MCAGREWNIFYVVRSTNGNLKFGITSNNPEPRLRAHKSRGYLEVVRLFTGLSGTIAPDTERAVIHALKLAGIEPIHGLEYFPPEALSTVLDTVDIYLRKDLTA